MTAYERVNVIFYKHEYICISLTCRRTILCLTQRCYCSVCRQRVVSEKGVSDIELYMTEEHEMLRRAATECMCNLVLNSEVSIGNIPQQHTTATYHGNIPRQHTTTTYHNNIPQQHTTAAYHGNIPQQHTMATYHDNIPQQHTAATYRGSIPRQHTTTTYHGNIPRQHLTAIPNHQQIYPTLSLHCSSNNIRTAKYLL